MSERKVLNKYYPPDFDPSKIPRMKLAKNRQYTVRLMAPFNMRCKTCGEYIYKGKKFNARKEDVENETYLGIRIYRFYIKCTRCLQEISFKTDPKSTDYEIEAGATRNFMALKLAEEQARREEEELREEEANNPMKLLENRTQQSRNEIEMLESLEELRDLNRRQQAVNYDSMLKQYNTVETEFERIEREKREDEELIKSMSFKNKSAGSKIIAEEIIEEIQDDDLKGTKIDKKNDQKLTAGSTAKVSKPEGATFASAVKSNNISKLVKRKQPLVLVKLRPKANESVTSTSTTSTVNSIDKKITETTNEIKNVTPSSSITDSGGGGGLSLLTAYSGSSDSE